MICVCTYNVTNLEMDLFNLIPSKINYSYNLDIDIFEGEFYIHVTSLLDNMLIIYEILARSRWKLPLLIYVLTFLLDMHIPLLLRV